MLNAAVWCGSSIFLTLALPALFSPDLKRVLSSAGVGFAAEAILSRYFILQYCCGAIALAHLTAEWFYFGRRWPRLDTGLVVTVLALSLIGGLWMQPKMRALHLVKYYGRTVEQQAQAGRAFGIWHGVSETANVVIIGCLIWYFWRAGKMQESPRFVSFSKMRG
jgi:hypothetical protein